MSESFDAVVVGSGPNGLAAAITLAQKGLSVQVLEAEDTFGGGMRSGELTLPGFVHDICSAIHPLALASPFLSTLPLAEHGLELLQPKVPVAHPLDHGRAAALLMSVSQTAEGLGRDAEEYSKLMTPFVRSYAHLVEQFLGPLRPPRHPLSTSRFGLSAIRSAKGLAGMFEDDRTRALLAGVAAHSILPLDRLATGGFGLILAILGHAVGWPVAKGGTQSLAKAMRSLLESLGGQVVTGREVQTLNDLPPHRVALLDVGPRQLERIAGERLPRPYRALLRRYRYGPSVFKVDWALDGPVPWRNEQCREAGTVHLGGTFEQISASERAVWEGRHVDRPYCIIAQQSVVDSSRAPEGKHTLWGYCHVPNGYTVDMSRAIEDQVERAAPGFRDLVLARTVRTPADLERENANYVGGDINGGVQDIRQLFTRPVPKPDPYSTPIDGLYLCSSSTPPGGGVHGMCGYYAAKSALRNEFR
ncbi:MAG TPA: NAD(P)/FAD-dependent oxidoreductase [Actinomycetota bacterium]|nr:NAD(P)/FAD-dependent oxidoreductase [Actinomycetota bacterium]